MFDLVGLGVEGGPDGQQPVDGQGQYAQADPGSVLFRNLRTSSSSDPHLGV
jgi:hypothetical protein